MNNHRWTSALILGLLAATAALTGCLKDNSAIQAQDPWDAFTAQESNRLSLSGEVAGFGRLPRDGKVDFALVTASMTRADLLNFDLSTLISPQSDRIEIIGKSLDLPSNIALPEQVENYAIISIRLNKPTYRSFVKTPGAYTFSALRGQFPVKQVVDDFRADKSIFEIMNHFNFTGVGQLETNLTASIEGQNIDVMQTTFSATTSVTAPQVAAEEATFALSLSDVNGQLSPVDLKSIKSGGTQALKVSPIGNPYVLAALVRKGPKGEMPQFDSMSLTLLPQSHSAKPDFLPLTQVPKVEGQVMTLFPPSLREGLTARAVYVSYSEVRPVESSSVDTEEKTVLWEQTFDGFLSSVELPELNFEKKPGHEYRFEVLYLAQDGAVPVEDTQDLLKQITHISRNMVDAP